MARVHHDDQGLSARRNGKAVPGVEFLLQKETRYNSTAKAGR
jgi:hypothetical protein